MIRAGVQVEENVQLDLNTIDTGYNVVFREGCIVEPNVCIWSNTVIDARAVILAGARIHCNCYIAQGCIVGRGVFMGPGVVLTNDRFPMRRDPGDWEPVTIRSRAVIGGGVVICPGVTIGEGAMIGAGAIVTKDVPDYQAWAGVPAKRIHCDAEAEWLASRDQADLLDHEEISRLTGG
jgi:acetyltransferase-like isoleucine patch superfamily enzyme